MASQVKGKTPKGAFRNNATKPKPAPRKQPRPKAPRPQRPKAPRPASTKEGVYHTGETYLGVVSGQVNAWNLGMVQELNPLAVSSHADDGVLKNELNKWTMYSVKKMAVKMLAVTGNNAATGSTAKVGYWADFDTPGGPNNISSVLKTPGEQLAIGSNRTIYMKIPEISKLIDTTADTTVQWACGSVIVAVVGATQGVVNTNSDNSWTGPLFQVYLQYTYHLTGPTDASLRGELLREVIPDSTIVKITETVGEPVELELTPPSHMLRGSTEFTQAKAALHRLGGPIIRTGRMGGLFSTVANVLAGLAKELPPPLNQILGGGIGLVRKVVGVRNGQRVDSTKFEIYQDMSAVSKDQPVIGTKTRVTSVPIVNGSFSQITDPQVPQSINITRSAELPKVIFGETELLSYEVEELVFLPTWTYVNNDDDQQGTQNCLSLYGIGPAAKIVTEQFSIRAQPDNSFRNCAFRCWKGEWTRPEPLIEAYRRDAGHLIARVKLGDLLKTRWNIERGGTRGILLTSSITDAINTTFKQTTVDGVFIWKMYNAAETQRGHWMAMDYKDGKIRVLHNYTDENNIGVSVGAQSLIWNFVIDTAREDEPYINQNPQSSDDLYEEIPPLEESVDEEAREKQALEYNQACCSKQTQAEKRAAALQQRFHDLKEEFAKLTVLHEEVLHAKKMEWCNTGIGAQPKNPVSNSGSPKPPLERRNAIAPTPDPEDEEEDSDETTLKYKESVLEDCSSGDSEGEEFFL